MKLKHLALLALLAAVMAASPSRCLAAEPAVKVTATAEQTPTGHQVSLTYTNPQAGTLVNIYRADVACSTNPTASAFKVVVIGAPQQGPAVDTTITVAAGINNWCYQATATATGVPESPRSASAPVSLTVSLQPPTGFAGTAN